MAADGATVDQAAEQFRTIPETIERIAARLQIKIENGRLAQAPRPPPGRGEGEMIGQNAGPIVKSHQRQVLDCLRSGDWEIVTKLPVAASPRALKRLTDYGWIERRGGGPRSEIKLTATGLAALRTPV